MPTPSSLIRAHTLPGTIIHSNQWAAYAQIATSIPHIARHMYMWRERYGVDLVLRSIAAINREMRYIAIKSLYRETRYIAINLYSYREINVSGR